MVDLWMGRVCLYKGLVVIPISRAVVHKGTRTGGLGAALADGPVLAMLPSSTGRRRIARPGLTGGESFTRLKPTPARPSTKAGQDVGRSPAGDEATR
jgi:hypothetical protein